MPLRWSLHPLPAVVPLITIAACFSCGAEGPGFRKEIAPVLADRCLTCHGPTRQKGGYRLDSFTRLLEPGDSGNPPILASAPERSHLFQLVTTSDPDDRMPQNGDPLEPAVIERIREWIKAGALFDGSNPGESLSDLLKDQPFPPAPSVYPFPIPVLSLAFLPEDRLAAGGYGEVTLWSAEGDLVRRLGNLPERIHALVPHPNGRLLAFAGGTPGRNGAAGWIDLGSNSPPTLLLRTADELLALALNADGSRIAVSGTDPTIAVFDSGIGKRVLSLEGHADWILDLAISRDGQLIASASRDRTARVYDLATGTWHCAFRDHNDAVMAVAFLPDGKHVASASRDGYVRTWDALTGKAVKNSRQIKAEPARLLATADRLLSTWTDGSVREFRFDDLELTQTRQIETDRILGLARRESDGRLGVTTYSGHVQAWDAQGGGKQSQFLAAPH